jgi:tripartite-type tricarboxylate transporter receptor subunit TctC
MFANLTPMGTPSGRRAFCALALAATLAFIPTLGCAQSFPSKPLQILVPFPAGTVVDTMARTFAQLVEPKFGQRPLVVNRDGGAFTIAMAAAAAAPADGYTLAMAPHTPLTIQLLRMKNLPYKRDTFIGLCQTYELTFFIATGPNSPFSDLRSVIEHARANPGKLRYGTSGIATVLHLTGAELWQRAGVRVSDVPYKSEALFIPNLLAGEIELGVVATAYALKLRPLLAFAAQRLPGRPDIPTAAELGYPVRPSGFGGIFVRAETPAPVVERLESVCREALADPVYRQAAERQFLASDYLGRAAFTARVNEEYESKAQLLRSLDLLE